MAQQFKLVGGEFKIPFKIILVVLKGTVSGGCFFNGVDALLEPIN
jgi:hypothetical protein